MRVLADGGEGVVAGDKVAAGDAVQGDGGGVELAGEARVQNEPAGGDGFVFEDAGAAGGFGPNTGDFGLARGVVENGGGVVHKS